MCDNLVCVCVCSVRVRRVDRGVAAAGVPARLLVVARRSRPPGATVRHQLRQADPLPRLQRPLVDRACALLARRRSLLQGISIIIIIKDIYIAQVRKGHKCAVGRDGSMVT